MITITPRDNRSPVVGRRRRRPPSSKAITVYTPLFVVGVPQRLHLQKKCLRKEAYVFLTLLSECETHACGDSEFAIGVDIDPVNIVFRGEAVADFSVNIVLVGDFIGNTSNR